MVRSRGGKRPDLYDTIQDALIPLLLLRPHDLDSPILPLCVHPAATTQALLSRRDQAVRLQWPWGEEVAGEQIRRVDLISVPVIFSDSKSSAGIDEGCDGGRSLMFPSLSRHCQM